MGVEGGDPARRGSLGWLATAVVAAIVVVVGVDTWAAEATARGAQALSANALRSVELSEEMRRQLTRLTPGPGDEAALDPVTAQALLVLRRDVRASEALATSESGRQEWLRLSALSLELADAWSRGDAVGATSTATSATESAERLIALNRTEADAIGNQVVRLARSQVVVNALAGALVLIAVAELARARLRSLERERAAIARTLEAVEDKNRQLEAFAGRVAHDLRAPLTPVQMLAGLLARGGHGEGDIRRVAGKIAGAASRMSDMIEGMLAFSRSGRLAKGDCAAGSVLANVLDELRPGSENVELHVDLPDVGVACPPEVFGQIVRNLLGNALKYRSAERPCRVDVTGTIGPRTLTLAVADNGMGMDARTVRRAFEPFFRASTDRPGQGLGLAIVDRYVRALGGSIVLRSRLGAGTRIEVRLPRAPSVSLPENVTPVIPALQPTTTPRGPMRRLG